MSMKNQVDYFERVVKILRELKKSHPDVEVSTHYILATDGATYSLSDKELFLALQRHQGQLEMNTVSDKDLEKLIDNTEDLFKETDLLDDEDWDNEDWD